MIVASTAPPQTVADWFARLNPPPPAALATELEEQLLQHAHRPVSETAEVCMLVAEQSLERLFASGSSERGSALALLSIDALVTYAFEAAADEPARIESRAAQAMSRIALLAEQASE